MSEATIYVNLSDEPECYFPVEHYTLNEARAEASRHAGDTLGGRGRSRYTGKRTIPLVVCADFEECGRSDHSQPVECWTFDLYEGTWRR